MRAQAIFGDRPAPPRPRALATLPRAADGPLAKSSVRPDAGAGVRAPEIAATSGVNRSRELEKPRPDGFDLKRPGFRPQRHALGLGAAVLLLRAASAVAFPLIDPTNQDQVPTGTELASPDAQDLQHQLQLADGLAAPAGGGWTVLPRLDAQELLTDNVLQQHAPRQWDLVTYLSPGIGVAADLPRLQLTFDFAPTLAVYAHAGSLNALTQQLTGIGLVTVVPDLAYVDVRALSGVHSLYGGIGGLGTIGASPTAINTAAASIPSLAGNSIGLNKDNEVQTSSFAISPYLLRRFGDYGTGKLGYSLAVTRSDQLTGFFSTPFPAGGGNGQTQVTNEELAHYDTGDFLGSIQNGFDVDLRQSNASTDAGFVTGTTGVPGVTNTTTSTREVVTDQVNYRINRAVTVFVSGGHENITYSGIGLRPIDDLTWSVGTTLTPNPDSLLTVSYGHHDGYNAFSANGYYAVTARTTLTVSYASTLGTQLENLQGQLNQAATSSSGSLVNAQTGGPLFGATNALGVQDGVFRTDTLTLGGQMTWERDVLSASLFLTKQTQAGQFQTGQAQAGLIQAGSSNGATSTSKTASVQWIHQLRPDLTLSGAVAFSRQEQAAGILLNPGTSNSVAASVALQHQISDTVGVSLRYSLFDRQSAVAAYSVYQNILILAISKTF